MWICLNDAFLSIIDPAAKYGGGGFKGNTLMVRARRKGDIEKVFPDARVQATPHRDYAYRAEISRKKVAAAIADEIDRIDYKNFKGSVGDDELHDAYCGIWSIMFRLQNRQQSRAAQHDLFGQEQ